MEGLTDDLYETIIINKDPPIRFSYYSLMIPYSIIIKRGKSKSIKSKVFLKYDTLDLIRVSITSGYIKWLYLPTNVLDFILSIKKYPTTYRLHVEFPFKKVDLKSFQNSLLCILLIWENKLFNVERYFSCYMSTTIDFNNISLYDNKILVNCSLINRLRLPLTSEPVNNFVLIQFLDMKTFDIEFERCFGTTNTYVKYSVYNSTLTDSIKKFCKNNIDKITTCEYRLHYKYLINNLLRKDDLSIIGEIKNIFRCTCHRGSWAPITSIMENNIYYLIFCFSLSLEYSEAIMLCKQDLIDRLFDFNDHPLSLKDLTIKYLLSNKEAYFSHKDVILPHKLKPLDPIMKIKQFPDFC